MSDKEQMLQALAQAFADSRKELGDNPAAATGKCVITSGGGWTECKDGITKESCDKQGGPGFTTTWTEGASC
jgi:hypothetical protein